MKLLLLLVLMIFQEDAPGARARSKPATVENLIEDLDNDNPVIREVVTKQLIERENELNRFKTLTTNTLNLEVKWRLDKIIKSIEANQKFRSMTIISPLITLKYEGTLNGLFTKLAEITGQKFDARAFGDNKTSVDCTDTPLFKLLDLACNPSGYNWTVTYRDDKENIIDSTSPMLNHVSMVEITSLGMSDKTPCYTSQAFKMQVVQTSFSINNKFGEVVTQAAMQFKYAADPGLKFAIGPKIKFTTIITDTGVKVTNSPSVAPYVLFQAPPTTKNVSIKGKATYRIPMKIETITLDYIDTLKPDTNGNDAIMEFADHSDIVLVMSSQNNIHINFRGPDNLVKERFTGKFAVVKKGGTTILENGAAGGSGYITVNDDHLQLYIYGTPGTDDAISKITFEYITEFRDIEFDFTIDNIPLY